MRSWLNLVLCSTNRIRSRSFRARIDVDNPHSAIRHVSEELDALRAKGQQHTTAYLHKLINLAICNFHSGDLIEAHKLASLAHQAVVDQKGSHHSLVYFSATTASHCASALANSFEAYRSTQLAQSHNSDSLLPSASKSLRGDVTIRELRSQAVDLYNAAQRCRNNPRNAFMNPINDGSWEDAGASNATDDDDTSFKTERTSNRTDLKQAVFSRVPK